MTISPKMPECEPDMPPTFEMPLVENVLIAWITATKGRSPLMINNKLRMRVSSV